MWTPLKNFPSFNSDGKCKLGGVYCQEFFIMWSRVKWQKMMQTQTGGKMKVKRRKKESFAKKVVANKSKIYILGFIVYGGGV